MARLDILGRVYNGQSEWMRWIQLSPCPRSFIHFSYSLFLLIKWVTSYILKKHNGPFWLTHHQKKLKLGKPPKIIVFMWGGNSSPLPNLYRWKEDNICQNIWGKSEVLLGTLWGTCRELGNFLLWFPPPKKKTCMESPLSKWKWTMGSPLFTLNTIWK